MSIPVSAIVICGNEENNIAACLTSLSFASEIIVVDSQSTDGTVEIAKKFTNKVFVKPWEGYAIQKQFALDQATQPWVLSLDADERVSDELRTELLWMNFTTIEHAAFTIPRKNFAFGKWIKNCGMYPDRHIRLFKKDSTYVNQVKVHEGFIVSGSIGELNGDIIHYTFTDIASVFSKINHYSSLQAESKKTDKVPTITSITLHTVAAFVNHFVGRKGYRDGIHGFVVSVIHATTTMLVYLKVWERSQKK